jgi:tetratricopeptide (TPR) repeat protein
MSSSSVLHYKGLESDPQKAGRELHVDAVFTGRIAKRGELFFVNAELVNVADNTQIWGAQHRKKAPDIPALEQDIVRDISDTLRLKLSGAEKEHLAKRATVNPEAYELYVRGRHEMYKWTDAGWKKSVDYLQQATDKDPSYAAAYAGLADGYALLGNGAYLPPGVAFQKAEGAANHAIALDESLGEAHLALALVRWSTYKFEVAETEFQRAIELSPNLSLAHQRYAAYLVSLRRFSEGLTEERRALDLDPLNLHANNRLGEIFLFQGDYDKAIGQWRKSLEVDPAHSEALYYMSYGYELKRQYDEATKYLDLALTSDGYTDVAAENERVYAAHGWKGLLRARIARSSNPKNRDSYDPYGVAVSYAKLGDRDQTFVWLDKTYMEQIPMSFLMVDPDLDPLRSDPRYTELVHRIGFPQ